jgi:hypothetical protein
LRSEENNVLREKLLKKAASRCTKLPLCGFIRTPRVIIDVVIADSTLPKCVFALNCPCKPLFIFCCLGCVWIFSRSKSALFSPYPSRTLPSICSSTSYQHKWTVLMPEVSFYHALFSSIRLRYFFLRSKRSYKPRKGCMRENLVRRS